MRLHSYHTISPRRGMTLLAALTIAAMGSACSQTSAGGHADDASNVASAGSAHVAQPAHASTAVHPELWPKAHWPLPADAALEHRVQALLAKMTVAEKVGQVIQADIESVTPAEVRQYHLGSILAGGNSKPGGGTVATPAQWLQLADAFHKASVDTSDGGVGIPLLFGFDAVHGANDVVGATLFPQNSA
ncbi:MAG TPA: glycoside hydrolase family 3 N-terminal domain-containing protein, partial [Oleiagrimonas sp.]|nr:glycoside hydrolase family 3 N-terminal domain-containing protein [Oleiagrimonas sp.]